MEHKRIRGGMAVLVATGTAVSIAATAAAASSLISRFSGELHDYRTAEAGPFDHATARLQLVDRTSGTTAVLHVRGVDPSVAGHTFGAHLHEGPCTTGNPAGALGHYNAEQHAGHSPAAVSDRTEVWLDFTVDASGAGDSSASVLFPVQPGARSVVIHADATNPATGGAGARLACLPVEW
jgi:Cu/Zn superoxide dismutase